ncbi:PAS domain-containing protein [Mesoterricola sediminis]|uniref:PAS domain-containing protein n=1 Tax=Mesoterricola sediminis TaxID=2927980 RepID=A0AA48HEL8_9BACT|nr:PAS domain-containing protein [Mesoterricola sediminis]BDU76833.1 hypothetical protein METESE_17910 [Mesoterricola sediminis]
MRGQDLLLALLLAVPPWVGFLLFRYRRRAVVPYSTFMGGILAVLSIPWPQLGTRGLPAAHLGGALLGFTLFLQALREGRQGVRNLAVGLAGATFFAWLIGTLVGMDMRSVPAFWGTALLEAVLWLLLSDLGYRLTRGRWLAVRMPAAGAAAFLAVTAIYHIFTPGTPPFSWGASFLAGLLLGAVALHQLRWLREQGIWVEGRGDGLRTALSALEGDQPPEGPTLAYAIEARQPMFLVNEKGFLLETNTAFSRLVGLPRHQMKGFQVQDLFQGAETPVWEDLRRQLLQDARGSAAATLVRRDATFAPAGLEAVAFDRNLALVWVVDKAPGTLALRGDDAPAGLAAHAAGTAAPHRLQAQAVLEALVPDLRRMLPPEIDVGLRIRPLTLILEEAPLRQALVQLTLHGRQALREGRVVLVLEPVELGGRRMARLSLDLEGTKAPWEGDFLGLTWLHQTVRDCGGILLVDRDAQGWVSPRLLLPRLGRDAAAAEGPLTGRTAWILHRDPALARAVEEEIREAGGDPVTFHSLRAFLAAARGARPPQVLVLERTRTLERYQARLCALLGQAVPALLLDDGRPLPQGDRAPSRLALLEPPFPGPDLVTSLLALLQ